MAMTMSLRLEGGVQHRPGRHGRTTSVRLAACATVPLRPVIVSVNVPRGVVRAVRIVTVAVRGAITGLGESVAVASCGKPAADRLTLPAKPPTDDTVTVEPTLWPATTVSDAGATATPKSGGAETTSVTRAVCAVEPLGPVTVSG